MKKVAPTAREVSSRIEKRGPGSIWTYADFKGLPFIAVAKALSRLTKEGKLVRAKKGVYHYPKVTALGNTWPSVSSYLKATHPWAYSGVTTAAYNLGITTQVPAHIELYGDISFGKDEFLGSKLRFRKRNVSHLKGLSENDVNIIETIRNIKKIPGVSPVEAIELLKPKLRNADMSKIIKAIEFEPPRVRAIVGALCEELKLESKKLSDLHATLNPLSKYKIGLSTVLLRAADWNIE
jgi:hypothetical protein